MTALSAEPRLRTPGAQAAFAALDAAGGQSRLVGGVVRDALLGLAVSDIDMATRLSPQEATARLAAAGIKVVPTGIAHGTVTAVTPDGIIEVTTLRRDVSTDGRHAVVAYTADWREDAVRRDFTINALYANPLTGEVFDEVGGLADLARRCVRFIGDPLQRIAEDHLRILRFFRFHARFGDGPPEAASLAACAARANDLMALSRERIRDELLKLLCVADPAPTVRTMIGHGILKAVLPEILDADGLARLTALETALGLPCVAIRRLAALLPTDAALLDGLGARLRLSNAERKRLVASAERLSVTPPDLRPLAYREGVDAAIDRVLLTASSSPAHPERSRGTHGLSTSLGMSGPQKTLAASLRSLDGWAKPRLPVSGRDIMALGVTEGPAVSRVLHAVEEAWIAAGFPPDRETALGLAQAAVLASR